MTPEDPRHGEYAGACAHTVAGEPLCDPCLEARRLYQRRTSKLRAMGRPSPFVELGVERLTRLQHARNMGFTYQEMSDQLGVGMASLHRWIKSGHGIRISKSIAQRIDTYHPSQPVTGIGVLRRLQALQWLGYSGQRISRHTSLDPSTIWGGLETGRTLWQAGTRDAIVAMFDELWDKPLWTQPQIRRHHRAAATRAHGHAVTQGWLPPMAWDNIDDPTERPHVTTQVRHSHEIDPARVTRLLAGERLPCTKAEKEETTRQWVLAGRSLGELEARHGWRSGRYGKVAEILAEAS